MSVTYNPLLVFLSIIVAFLSCYTTLELSGRIFSLSREQKRRSWLIAGAITMGAGVWSMHFIGLMAFSLPIPIGYDPWITAASFLLATAASLLALSSATQGKLSRMRLAVAGTLMGLGSAGVHYTGMAALQISPPVRYTLALVVASLAVSIAASIAALWLAFALRTYEQKNHLIKRLGAALIMALGMTGTHYIAMDAANFEANSICLSANQLDSNWLSLIISASSICMLIGTLAFLALNTDSLSSSLSRAHSQLHHFGTHDSLTSLPNRIQLAVSLQQAIDACNGADSMIALLSIGLDDFKTINDSLGRNIGDELLKTCANRLSENLRHDDMVARIGGDEFAIVADRLSDASIAGAIASSVLRELNREIMTGEIRIRLSASIGIALFPRDRNTFRFFRAEYE